MTEAREVREMTINVEQEMPVLSEIKLTYIGKADECHCGCTGYYFRPEFNPKMVEQIYNEVKNSYPIEYDNLEGYGQIWSATTDKDYVLYDYCDDDDTDYTTAYETDVKRGKLAWNNRGINSDDDDDEGDEMEDDDDDDEIEIDNEIHDSIKEYESGKKHLKQFCKKCGSTKYVIERLGYADGYVCADCYYLLKRLNRVVLSVENIDTD